MSTSTTTYVVNPAPAVAPAALTDALRGVVTPHLSDNLQRLQGITRLQRLHGGRQLIGTALTVKTRPGDNLLVYKALTLLRPGHVLVVDGGGDITNALVGDLMMSYAARQGCTGFVMNAAIRDHAAFIAADFPCYAAGISHRGPYKSGPGQVNVPVSIAGQVVNPGDIVVGDEDGIVVFSQAEAPALIEAAAVTAAKEAAIHAEIATGERAQSWLDGALRLHGL